MSNLGKFTFEQEFTDWLGTRSFATDLTVNDASLSVTYHARALQEHLSAVRNKLNESGIVFSELKHGKKVVVNRSGILPPGDDCVTIVIDASQFPKLTEVLKQHVRAEGDQGVAKHREEFDRRVRHVNAEVAETQENLSKFIRAHSKIHSGDARGKEQGRA